MYIKFVLSTICVMQTFCRFGYFRASEPIPRYEQLKLILVSCFIWSFGLSESMTESPSRPLIFISVSCGDICIMWNIDCGVSFLHPSIDRNYVRFNGSVTAFFM